MGHAWVTHGSTMWSPTLNKISGRQGEKSVRDVCEGPTGPGGKYLLMVGIMQKIIGDRSMEGGEWDRYEIDIKEMTFLAYISKNEFSTR